ncbi:STAS domain-containing protein [Streptomyces sp. HB2AG]|uniref:STAS domain-containing protein n=1 Tax=Streptomyces sp. HB2AG TaxID=2983400 RepID=UPI0022AA93EB|nr:STAS domain-containing protein [Streptomyces sp. HB2AG]MCZ2523834.1 STAS domain-containing protein [Streptomyces sp. HB2AG]
MACGAVTEQPCVPNGCGPTCRAFEVPSARGGSPARGGSSARGDRADWSVIPLRGELDLVTGPWLRACLDRHLAAGRCRIVVDLSDVTFMDCTTLGLLVRARKEARTRSGAVRLVAGRPQVLMLLDMTGMRRSFEVLPTLEAALAD